MSMFQTIYRSDFATTETYCMSTIWKWLNNIPYGQFCRIRQNCTSDRDYIIQSKILSERSKEKNYPFTIINESYKKAGRLTQNICIHKHGNIKKGTNKSSSKYKHSFVTTYNQNQRYIRAILERHWHVLKTDPFLKELIPYKPNMIFRRAQALKNILAPSNS